MKNKIVIDGVEYQKGLAWDDDKSDAVETYLLTELPGGRAEKYCCVNRSTIKEFEEGKDYYITHWENFEPLQEEELTHEKMFKLCAEGGVWKDGYETITNHWNTAWRLKTVKKICKKPDYSRKMEDWDWEEV